MWYFDPRIIPGTSHKLEEMQIIAPALAEIKPVYYPGEEKLVSIDLLKLYQGEDIVWQNPEDLELDWWSDEGELTEFLEVPREEMEVGTREQPEEQGRLKCIWNQT